MLVLNKIAQNYKIKIGILLCLGFLVACEKVDEPLAPYQGERELANIVVEEGTYIPKVTWLGGYVSVFAINQDTVAALDSTLIWLIRTDGDNIHFPVTLNQVPKSAQDLTSNYSGKHIEKLVEDATYYTFWVLKAEAWEEVKNHVGKPLIVDQNNATNTVHVRNDTVFLSPDVFSVKTQNIDVYINIDDVRSLGKLAAMEIQQTDTSNQPVISWKLKPAAGTTDSLISAFGLCLGQLYDPNTGIWEVWSEEKIGDRTVFGKKNVISSPIICGQTFPETRVIIPYSSDGLRRGEYYCFWIANKDWDGENHLRGTPNHAYLRFRVW